MKTVALVLGSGGARGYTHIGVIKEIEKEDIKYHALLDAQWGNY